MLSTSKAQTPRAPMGSKTYKIHLKEPYREIPAKPFTSVDYLLCALVYALLAVAWIPAFAGWILGR
jgi:hypothetical protein